MYIPLSRQAENLFWSQKEMGPVLSIQRIQRSLKSEIQALLFMHRYKVNNLKNMRVFVFM
jgi:hypothetical protein